MADSNTLLVGGGAGIIGLIIGFLIGGPDEDKLVQQIETRINAGAQTAAAASAEQIKAMQGEIAELEKALAAAGDAEAASSAALDDKLDAAVKGLAARIDAVSADMAAAVADAGAAQTAKMEAAFFGGLADLQGSIQALAVAAAASRADVVEPPAAPAEPEIKGARVGQTEVLMDGKVRVFVSSVDAEQGTARVAVNGQAMMLIGSYHDGGFMLGKVPCNVSLDDIVEGHVQMSASCEQ